MDGINGITLHYTASTPKSGIEAVEGIARYQVSPQVFDVDGNRISGPQEAFPGIAYTLIVDSAGTIYLCHDLSVRVWHSGAVVNGVARNASHVGICYIGDYEPTSDQLAGLAGAIQWTALEVDRALSLEGHGDVYSTPCPGRTWPLWMPLITVK